MRRMLVTGGAGFIGSNFVRHWRGAHPADHIVVLDKLTYAGNVANLEGCLDDGTVSFVPGDIGDEPLVERLLRDHAVDTVVHFAAESHVDRSITGPELFLTTNVMGTHTLLRAARKVWLQEQKRGTDVRFHHVSTDEVYGSLEPADEPFTESSPYAPNSPYAASKAASDHLVRAYHRTYGLPVTTSNTSNNYGPFQFPEKLIPLMIVNALDGKPLPIYGDGRQVRDWLYVEDHCRGIARVLEAGVVGETYNIGGESERANIELVELLCGMIDRAFSADPGLTTRFPRSPAARGRTRDLITRVADRPGHDRRYAINTARVTRDLGFRPSESVESGLARTLSWYLEHESIWRAVQDGSYRDWMRQQYGMSE